MRVHFCTHMKINDMIAAPPIITSIYLYNSQDERKHHLSLMVKRIYSGVKLEFIVQKSIWNIKIDEIKQVFQTAFIQLSFIDFLLARLNIRFGSGISFDIKTPTWKYSFFSNTFYLINCHSLQRCYSNINHEIFTFLFYFISKSGMTNILGIFLPFYLKILKKESCILLMHPSIQVPTSTYLFV